MKHPFYTLLALLSCGYLLASNSAGWSLLQSRANRAAFQSTAYRYRPAVSSGGGWFSGGGFHK